MTQFRGQDQSVPSTQFMIKRIGKEMKRRGLTERATKQDKDIKGRKGTQPAKYHKGLGKSTKAKRDAQFKKGASLPDGSGSSYKPAPGDARAKTKVSKHTKKYKQMFGEKRKDDPCWDGWKQLGMKKKGGKQVPNCVKEDDLQEKTWVDSFRQMFQKAKMARSPSAMNTLKKLYMDMKKDGVNNPIGKLAQMTSIDASDLRDIFTDLKLI